MNNFTVKTQTAAHHTGDALCVTVSNGEVTAFFEESSNGSLFLSGLALFRCSAKHGNTLSFDDSGWANELTPKEEKGVLSALTEDGHSAPKELQRKKNESN